MNYRTRIMQILKLLGLMILSCNAMAGSLFSMSAGHEQTTGAYGLTSETEVEITSLFAEYTINTWRFNLYIPFVSVTGDGSVIPRSGGTGYGGGMGSGSGFGNSASPSTTTTIVETQSGLGDITTSLSYAFFPKNDSFMFYALTGKLKLGTASVSKNLGNGENDFSLSLYSEYEKYNVQPFLTVGYLFFGDTDAVNFNDVIFVTAGFTYHINPNTSFGLAYEYQQTAIDGADDSAMIKLNLNRRLSPQWSASVYFLAGISDSVADSGIGLTLGRDF